MPYLSNRLFDGRLVHRYKRRRVVTEVAVERFVDGGDMALITQQAREVNAACDGPSQGLSRFQGDIEIESLQSLHHALIALATCGLHLGQPGGEFGGGAVAEEVSE